MRLMVPASSLNDTIQLLKAGADDIYLGIQSECFNQYSFNGRAKTTKSGKLVLPSIEEFSKICSFVHQSEGCVYFLANTPIFNCCLKNEFLEYIYQGMCAGADYVILGDIYAIQMVAKEFPEIKIVASSYVETQNIQTIMMLEQLGVSQAVLSYQSSLEEIKMICEKSSLDIEVFGHGGCSFYVGTCNMFHEMGEKVEIGYPCRAKYSLFYKEEYLGDMRILDCFKMCSLCKIKDLIAYNVHTLKIVGRDLPASYIMEIVKIYSEVIRCCKYDVPYDLDKILPVWWKKVWCDGGFLCRYGGNNVYY